jgi:peptidoglycan/LPS O-acetylase OafA/YrhL
MMWIARHANLISLIGIGLVVGIGGFWFDRPETFPHELPLFMLGCVLLVVAAVGNRFLASETNGS